MANVASKKSGATRKTASNHIKDQLYTQYGVVCAFCGKENTEADETGKISREGFNIDHKIPIAKGGEDVVDNMQILCRECNVAKGELTNAEYWAKVGRDSAAIHKTVQTLFQETGDLNLVKHMYRPLTEDVYESWVIFYTAIIDTTFSGHEIRWLQLPLSLVEEFCKKYNVSRDDLLLYMKDIHKWLDDVEKEKMIKQRVLSAAHVNTLERQGNNLNAVTINRDLMRQEQKVTNVVININPHVLDYARKYVEAEVIEPKQIHE